MAKIAPKLGEAGEKSPGVHYANWKEDILLKKQLHVLNRSEKSVVHRIKIDQKVLFKRFQEKLYRSKLSQARLWGDKEKERELRARNLHALHTDLGSEEKDYEFLKKLKYNPCKKNGPTLTRAELRPKSHIRTSKPKKVEKNQIDVIIDSVFDEDEKVFEFRERSNSVTEGMIQDIKRSSSKETDSKALGTPQVVLRVRPSTTDGQPSRSNGLSFPVRVKTSIASCEPPKQKSKVRTSNKISPQNSLHPKRRQSIVDREGKTRKKSSSFFEEEEKINLVEKRLREMKSISYDTKINTFYDTLESLACDKHAHSDYYTLRLQAASKECGNTITPVPGTPEEQYEKHFGNLEIKSLTFKSLNLDFSKKDHQSQDTFRPDLQVNIAESSDEYSSDSDIE